jgi:hypothetical protein
MSDATPARDAFEARLHELQLDGLDTREIDRLWQSRLKQIAFTERLAANFDPIAESALQLAMTRKYLS